MRPVPNLVAEPLSVQVRVDKGASVDVLVVLGERFCGPLPPLSEAAHPLAAHTRDDVRDRDEVELEHAGVAVRRIGEDHPPAEGDCRDPVAGLYAWDRPVECVLPAHQPGPASGRRDDAAPLPGHRARDNNKRAAEDG